MHDDLTPHRDNHEAAMARADLYKLANYSMKLFKMIQEGQELEGWVQAKVTKAADYIASVYHFMEYEMKTSEYGENLNNSDVYSESVRRVFQQRLTEAKAKAQAIKKKAMKDEKVEEGFPTVADAKARHEKEKGTGKFEKKKVSTGTVYTRKADKDIESDDDEDTPKKSKKVKEGAKPDFLDIDKDGNKKEPMKKAVADKKKNPFAKKVEEDTRLAMRSGPGAQMKRYEKDSPDPGAKQHRDDTAKAAKAFRSAGGKMDDGDEVGRNAMGSPSRNDKGNAALGDKQLTRYDRERYAKEGIADMAGTAVGTVEKGISNLKKKATDAAAEFSAARSAASGARPAGQAGQLAPGATQPPKMGSPGSKVEPQPAPRKMGPPKSRPSMSTPVRETSKSSAVSVMRKTAAKK
jgi:hypothetical protein